MNTYANFQLILTPRGGWKINPKVQANKRNLKIDFNGIHSISKYAK